MMQTGAVHTERFERMADMLKAIAHPMRVAIVRLLHEQKELTVTEIYEEMQVEQAVASQQLSVLKSREVVEARRDGKNTFYSLKYPQLATVIRLVEECGEC